MKIAVIADVHGNAPALEAVLADIAGHAFDVVVHLGDAFNGPIDPAGVMRMLKAVPMLHVRGNGERMVLSEDETTRARSAAFARERLDSADLQWVAGWPATLDHPEFFACHGSPSSDVEYLTEEPVGKSARLLLPHEVETRLGATPPGLVLCAHSHVPRFVRVTDQTWILNPGSVGLPAYSLPSPIPHTIQVGSPSARYAIAEKLNSGWRVSHLALPYDHEAAASVADREGFPEWAAAIRTGYAA